MDARHFTTPQQIQKGLDAIPAKAVSRADGRLHITVWAGHHWAQADGRGPAEQDVAQVPPTELGAWLAERLDVVSCEACEGHGRHVDQCECQECGSADCLECDGQGHFLAVRDEWLDSPLRAHPPVVALHPQPETDGAA